jgi:hypothetical protein
MAEILFINDVYIKKYTQVNGAVDSNILYPAVYLAQDKYLLPYLGTNLFEKLKDDVANSTLSGNYETLVNDYVQRVVLWWTMVEVMPFLTYKLDNGTLVQRTSEDAAPVSDRVFKDMLERAVNNAEHYTGLLVDFLCAYSNLFPEYNNNVFPQRCPIQIKKANSAYIFSCGNTVLSNTNYGNVRINQIP